MNAQSKVEILVAIALGISACTAEAPGVEGGNLRCGADSTVGDVLVINEFMAANAVSFQDDEGASHDWIEIYNPTTRQISLCGWSLTTDLSEPTLFTIANDLLVPPGGHVVAWMIGDRVSLRPDQIALSLPTEGGEIGLTRPGGQYADQLVYGHQAVDLSASRTSDGSDSWVIAWHISPGKPNTTAGVKGGGYQQPDTLGVVPAAGDLTELIMGYDEVPELDLQISASGIERLRDEPYQYVQGFIVYDGREYGPVGVRLKGANSFEPIDQKPSFRLNIDEYVSSAKFFGLDDLTLNNMHSDFSMMHERLAYLVARQLGPASRANHALVYVNGDFYGLYANVETVKRHMLENWFADSSGSLYEATDVDFRDELIDGYELESGADDRTLLVGLTEALKIESPDEAIAAASDFVHIGQFLRYWSMCVLVGQFDAFPYSNPGDDYFVYADPTTQKLWFLPWGMDETFYSSEFDIRLIHSVLAEKCLASTSCHSQLAAQIWQGLNLFEDMNLAAERLRVAYMIAPYVELDSRKPYTDSEVAEFQNQMRWFIEGRRAQISAMLAAGPQ